MGKHENFGIENRQKKKSKGKIIIKRIVLTIFVLVVIGGAAAFGFGYLTLSRMSSGKTPAKKVAVTKPVNILVLGVDAGDYTNHTKNNPNRSDTMMLVRFNPKTGRVYMLSLPRDTKVKLNGHTQKLNAAHKIGGVPYTIETIEKMLNVDINYYAEINYTGFRECVDAIGGVDIVIPRDMNYDAWKISIHFKKGEKVHMNGEKAEQYVRWRKNNDGGGYAMGDLGRINTQQEFMVKLVEKMKTTEGIFRMPAVLSTVSKYIETNMDATTMSLYALEARKIKGELVKKQTLPGVAKYIGDVSYYVWNKDLNDKFLANFRGIEEPVIAKNNGTTKNPKDDTVSGNENKPVDSSVNVNADADANSNNRNDDSNTTPTDSIPQANPDSNNNSVPSPSNGDSDSDNNSNIIVQTSRDKMDVALLNSTGVSGLAAKYKAKLEKLGYKVTQTGNYPYEKFSSTIINDYSKSGYGTTLKNDLNIGKLIIKDKKKKLANLVVILGTDSIK